jgi:ferredoxin
VKGIIYSGLLAGPVEEALDELRLQDQPRLRLSAFSPLAEATLVQFLQSVSDVLILEEQMPFLESQIAALALRKGIHVRVLGKMEGAYTPFKTGVITKDLAKRALQRFVREPSGEQADAVPAAPMPASPGPHADLAIPRALLYCPGCPHAAAHFALNFAFDAGLQVWRQREPMIRSSDIGCYGSLPSFLAEAELKFHMGGGFGLAGGLARCPLFTPLGGETVSHPLVVAFAGDSTFFHSAVIRLLDAAANRAPCLYVVFDNKTVALTGLQPVPALPMAALAETMGVASRVVNVFDVWGASRAFGDSIDFVTNEKKPALIVAEGECALLPHAPQLTSRKYRVAEDKCDNCGLCVEGFHCPALVRGPASLLSQPHAAQQHPFPSSTQAANPPKPSILPDICVGCGVCEIVCRYSLTVQHTARQVGAIESVPPSSATAHPSPPLPQPALQSYLAPCRLPAATCNLPFNLVLAGVGGLGLPDLAELIVRAAHLAGHKAVRAFVKGGISERFGAVYAMIRIGPAARTSSLSPGEADVVLAMEPLEALRACCGDGRMPAFASPSCTSVALSMLPFPPLAVTLGQRAYPSWENLLGALEETCASVHPVSPHPDFLTRPLAHNLYLLGAACHLFEHVLSPEALRQAVAELAPNALAAFDAGRADHRPPPARS